MGTLDYYFVITTYLLLFLSIGARPTTIGSSSSSIDDVGINNNNNNENNDNDNDNDSLRRHEEVVKNGRRRKLIFGGTDAPLNRYPYTVSLQSRGLHVCGGSMIASNLVLTAAHCFKQQGLDANTMVVINPYKLDSGNNNNSFTIENFEIHPHYVFCFKYSTYYHDVAIIKIINNNNNYETSAQQPIVQLNSNSMIPEFNTSLRVMGWGSTEESENNQYSNILKEVTIQSLTTRQCQTLDDELMEFTTSDMLCARAPDKDSCSGDSGGPLIRMGNSTSDDIQVGIVSFGSLTCASEFSSGVYARIDREYDWIRSVVCDLSYDVAPSYFKCNETTSIWMAQYPIPNVPAECTIRTTQPPRGVPASVSSANNNKMENSSLLVIIIITFGILMKF